MEEPPVSKPDPAERRRRLPEPPRAEEWTTGHDVDPVPGSISGDWSPGIPGTYGDVEGGGDSD